jgi:hypothetical protein
MKFAKVVAAAVIALSLHEPASGGTIDFNSVPLDSNGQFVAQSYVEGPVTITRLNGPVVIEDGAPNLTTALVGYNDLAGSQWRATFSSTQSSVSIDLGDFGFDADTIFLTAFDAANNQIGTVTLALASSFSGMVTLGLTAPGIKFIQFGNSAGVGIYADNLVFTSPVPIPAVLPIFAAAVGFLSFIGWRVRRRSLTVT